MVETQVPTQETAVFCTRYIGFIYNSDISAWFKIDIVNLFLIIFTVSERHMCTSFLWQTNTKSCNYRFITLLGTPEKSAGIPRTAKYLSFPLMQLLSSNCHNWYTTDIYKDVVLNYKFEMHHQYLRGNVLKIHLQTPKCASILCAAETISPNKN